MKFGTKVWVMRGGTHSAPGTPGSRHQVAGTLVGARGQHTRWVRLDEDDPLDTSGWNKKGQVGRWSPSAVEPRA